MEDERTIGFIVSLISCGIGVLAVISAFLFAGAIMDRLRGGK